MLNYFELFGLPTNFDVDLKRLSQNYQELQKLTHPDKFAGHSEQQQRLSMQKNSQVNDGFQVLKSPVLRAEHLLSLRGVEIANETQTMQDMTFLMQQMEWREALEDSSKAADPQSVLDNLQQDVDEQRRVIKQMLSDLLELNTHESNQTAADQVRKLKFIDKMHSEIAEQEEKLFS